MLSSAIVGLGEALRSRWLFEGQPTSFSLPPMMAVSLPGDLALRTVYLLLSLISRVCQDICLITCTCCVPCPSLPPET
jgi:hypothetical protein